MNRELVIQAALEARDRVKPHFQGSLVDTCDFVSESLRRRLLKDDVQSQMVKGTFRTDLPLPAEYGSIAATIALHVWLEVDGLIVDASADQFNPWLTTPLAEVVVGQYTELKRWTKTSDHPGLHPDKSLPFLEWP